MMGIMFGITAIIALCILSEMAEILGVSIGLIVIAALAFLCFPLYSAANFFMPSNIRTCIQLVLCYFLLGLAWSFVNFSLKARKSGTDGESDEYTRTVKFNELMAHVPSWIILWPFSMLASLLTDLLEEVVTFAVDKIRFMYRCLFNWVIRSKR